jgi:hypothetical protein
VNADSPTDPTDCAHDHSTGQIVQDIERRMRAAPPAPKPVDGSPPVKATPPPTPLDTRIEIGKGLEVPLRDPLTFIKSGSVPVLSSEKKKRKENPLEFLVQVWLAGPHVSGHQFPGACCLLALIPAQTVLTSQ